MNRSLWIAKSGMEGQQSKLDSIANNLANVGTNGYKRGSVVFEDLMYDSLRQVGAASGDQSSLPTGLQVGLGTRVAASTRNFAQGNLQNTGNNLDVAIKGAGFFQIQLPDGTTAYTRDGSFQLDANGQIVTNSGHVLQPGIAVPANAQSVTVAADGTVSVTLPAQPQPQQIGQLQVATEQLHVYHRSRLDNLLMPADGGEPIGAAERGDAPRALPHRIGHERHAGFLLRRVDQSHEEVLGSADLAVDLHCQPSLDRGSVLRASTREQAQHRRHELVECEDG